MARRELSTRRMREPFEDPNPVTQAVVNAITVTTSFAIEEAATMRRSRFLVLLNVVRAAFRATPPNDSAWPPTRSVVVGVIRGASLSGTVTTQCFADLGEAVVKATAETGGDLGVATRELIEGSASVAAELGMDEATAASAAASGALETVEEFGAESKLDVCRGIAGTARGVRAFRLAFQ